MFKRFIERAAAKASLFNIKADVVQLSRAIPHNPSRASHMVMKLVENVMLAFANQAAKNEISRAMAEGLPPNSETLKEIVATVLALCESAHTHDQRRLEYCEDRLHDVFRRATGSDIDRSRMPWLSRLATKGTDLQPPSRRQTQNNDKLQELIVKQAGFAVNAIDYYKRLFANAPNRQKCIFELFLYHNWVSYHIISTTLLNSLSPSAPEQARQQLLVNTLVAVVTEAEERGLKMLRQKYALEFSDYSEEAFSEFAGQSLGSYDSSVGRHTGPAHYNAAVALLANCGLTSLVVANPKKITELTEEICGIYLTVEELIQKDAQQFLGNRR